MYKRQDILDALTKGRNRIEHGWTKGTYKKGAFRPKYCLVGAIGGSDYDFTVYNELNKVLQDKGQWGGLINFNDRVARDKEDVLSVFDQAIKNVKENRWYN